VRKLVAGEIFAPIQCAGERSLTAQTFAASAFGLAYLLHFRTQPEYPTGTLAFGGARMSEGIDRDIEELLTGEAGSNAPVRREGRIWL